MKTINKISILNAPFPNKDFYEKLGMMQAETEKWGTF